MWLEVPGMAEKYTYKCDASLRIWNAGPLHERITAETGLHPTRSHLKGTKRHPNAKPEQVWKQDLWTLESPLPKSDIWDEHIRWIWAQVQPHKTFFQQGITGEVVADLCLGCMTDSEAPILRVDAGALGILRELPLGICFNYTPL